MTRVAEAIIVVKRHYQRHVVIRGDSTNGSIVNVISSPKLVWRVTGLSSDYCSKEKSNHNSDKLYVQDHRQIILEAIGYLTTARGKLDCYLASYLHVYT